MFGIGAAELGIIILVILIFIRPKDIPGIMRKVGALYRRANDQVREIKKAIGESPPRDEGDDS